MKLSKLMFRHINLTISSIMVLMLSLSMPNSVMAAEMSGLESKPYQSSFEGYQPLVDENLADWKTLNEQSAASGQSMPGMSGSSDMSNMQGMDHSKMKDMKMDKSDAKSDMSDMSNMKGMDHSKMQGMNMDKSNAKSGSTEMPSMRGMKMDNSDAKSDSSDMSNMKAMNHSKMQGMNMDKPSTKPDSPDMSNMPGMDRGTSSTKSGNSNMSNMKDMDSAAENAKPDNSNMKNMEGMDHSKMQGMNQNEATQVQPFRIIPNLHPIAVHFPIVLILIAFIFSLTAFTLRQHALATHIAATGRFSLWLAGLSAVIAALLGWLAFDSVNHDDAGHAAMLLHRAWAIPTASGIVLLAAWDIWKKRATDIMPVPVLILLFLLSTAIAITGWLGGEVVYRHGIGVLSMPAMEVTGNGNKHEHGGTEVMAPADSAVQTEPNTEGESHDH